MHVTGLITEYNPFHNGHLFHIRRAREVAGADFLIVLMSGSFVQRGAPAIFDKYSRARAALLCGADVVAEMPVTFSTASAREFASYGIALFTALGAVDSICFGSECGEIGPLFQTARLLVQEPEGFKEALGNALRQGKPTRRPEPRLSPPSFPAATSCPLPTTSWELSTARLYCGRTVPCPALPSREKEAAITTAPSREHWAPPWPCEAPWKNRSRPRTLPAWFPPAPWNPSKKMCRSF